MTPGQFAALLGFLSRSRRERLLLAAERLEADAEVERRAHEAYQHYRATARDRLGRRVVGRPEPYRPPEVPAGKVNITDPDSRSIPVGFGFVRGRSCWPRRSPTLVDRGLRVVALLPEAVVADAGYWNEQHMDEVTANKHIPVLIPPDKGSRGTPRPGWTGGRYSWMRTVLTTEHGRRAYSQTQTDGRAAVRRHQTQQWRPPLPQASQEQGAHRVAITDDEPQPRQASPPPARRRSDLKTALRRSHRHPPRARS
jgi:hypothetical protein